MKFRKEWILTAKQMKEADNYAIRRIGLPSAVLMERAAFSCAQALAERMPLENGKRPARVLAVCGCGNNGGDGLAAGRILQEMGYEVRFVLVGDEEKCSPETKRQLIILQNIGISVPSCRNWPEGTYDAYIDALFGIGLSREVTGFYAEAVERINGAEGCKLSVDIPSGICADDGRVMGCAVRADVTVTFAFRKWGHIWHPGCAYAGEVICAPIGIPEESLTAEALEAYTYAAGREGIEILLPKRRQDGNKGSFGKVFLLAGSREISGACQLCAEAVLRSGAGMVKVLTAEENREILQKTLPEVMTSVYAGRDDTKRLRELAAEGICWADVVAVGPGLSTGEQAAALLTAVLEEGVPKPLVIDADGLNLLAAQPSLLNKLAALQQKQETHRPLLLTPHLGEFARLAGVSVKEVQPLNRRIQLARELQQRLDCQLAVKDARTLVFTTDGRVYVNGTGNDGMATAGSGDVLTGMLAALLAQGLDEMQAAAAAVWLHGMAGDAAAAANGRYAMTARDLIEAEKQILP